MTTWLPVVPPCKNRRVELCSAASKLPLLAAIKLPPSSPGLAKVGALLMLALTSIVERSTLSTSSSVGSPSLDRTSRRGFFLGGVHNKELRIEYTLFLSSLSITTQWIQLSNASLVFYLKICYSITCNRQPKGSAINAGVAELADAHDSKSCGATHESSILSSGTIRNEYLNEKR